MTDEKDGFDSLQQPIDITKEEAEATITKQFPPEIVRDGRRKYALPEGVVPGTPSYWKWYRETFRERNRLYQKKSYLKRKLMMAAIKVSNEEGIPHDEAMLHVEAQLDAISMSPEFRQKRANAKAEPEEEPLERIPFIAELADEQGVTYEDAERIMNAEDYVYPDSFITFKLRKGSAPSL